jgi:four helix bundle protein
MPYQSFEDLEVWQRGCRLSVSIFETFANCRTFSLKDQVERSGLSIPSNIAEGAERGSAKDFAHFLNFSKGSCGELRTQLYIARKPTLLPKKDFDDLVSRNERDFVNASRIASVAADKGTAKMKRARRGPSLKLNS